MVIFHFKKKKKKKKKGGFSKKEIKKKKMCELTFRRAVDSGGSELVVVCAE